MRKRLNSFLTKIVGFFKKSAYYSIFPIKKIRIIFLFGILCICCSFYIYSAPTQKPFNLMQLVHKTTYLNNGLIHHHQSMQSSRIKIDPFKSKLAKFKELASKLETAVGFNAMTDEDKQMGVGGVFAKEIALMNNPSGYNQWLKKHDEELNQLKYKTVDQLDEYQGLLETVKEIRRIQDATPSIYPVEGGYISSNFGYRKSPFDGSKEFHCGLDIADRKGTPVVATADGMVRHDGGLGKAVIIDHGFGIITGYGHLSKVIAKAGQQVRRGDVIGKVGSTGKSTGPHLHYEVRLNNKPVNPKKYLPQYLASSGTSK